MASCPMLIVGISALMPHLTALLQEEWVYHASGAASLMGHHAALGYILMGLLSFLLSVCVTVLLYCLRRREERPNRGRLYMKIFHSGERIPDLRPFGK